MRMIITAPARVDGKPHGIGDEVEVEHEGEAIRLAFYGQAVPATNPHTHTHTQIKITAPKEK